MNVYILLFSLFILFNIAFQSKMEGKSPLYIAWIIIADIVISIGSAYIPGWYQAGEISYTFSEWLPDQLYAFASWAAYEWIVQYPYISMYALICAVSGFIVGMVCHGPFFRNYDGIKVLGFMFPGIMLLYYLKIAFETSKLLFTGVGLKMLREDHDYAAFFSALFTAIALPVVILTLPYILSVFFIRTLRQSPLRAVQCFAVYCLVLFVIFIVLRFRVAWIHQKEGRDYLQPSMKCSDAFLSILFEMNDIVYLAFIIFAWYLSI